MSISQSPRWSEDPLIGQIWPIRAAGSVMDKPLELRVYSGLRRQAFTALAPLASVFWSSTRLGILDFSADLRVLGSEYSTFWPTFEYSARNTRLFGRTSECNHSETVCPNHLKFAVQVVPTMDPCGLEFQVIRPNGSQVIAVGSWAEKIGNLQFPVRLTDSLLI